MEKLKKLKADAIRVECQGDTATVVVNCVGQTMPGVKLELDPVELPSLALEVLWAYTQAKLCPGCNVAIIRAETNAQLRWLESRLTDLISDECDDQED